MSGNMETTASGQRIITAVFDDLASAERAARELAMRIGGVRGEIHDRQSPDLDNLSLPQTDLGGYREAVRRGHVVFSARVPEAKFDAAAQVIEECGAVDFDRREESWREEGWDATQDAAPGGTAMTASPAATASATGGESIPVVEERLRVGKRETGHGRVRLRSYVVETPVEEQVNLRREHVEVERHAVDRPVADADHLFQERTLEATETSEEAVVSKEARVTEEVALHKDAEQRTETVRDTVRHTEVEVDDDRRGTAATGREPAPRRDSPRRGA